jgi:membrane protein YqaA with SNARE-associated domain
VPVLLLERIRRDLSSRIASTPIPLSPFALAAGALGVSRNRFFAVYGTARSVRYSFIA